MVKFCVYKRSNATNMVSKWEFNTINEFCEEGAYYCGCHDDLDDDGIFVSSLLFTSDYQTMCSIMDKYDLHIDYIAGDIKVLAS